MAGSFDEELAECRPTDWPECRSFDTRVSASGCPLVGRWA
jgi:hypothetical protein